MKAPERKPRGSRRKSRKGWKVGPQWILPDQEWLNHQYWILQKSAIIIASEVGVSVRTIRNWMKKLGISSRTATEASLTRGRRNPEWPKYSKKYFGKKAREVVDAAGIPNQCEMCGWKDPWLVIHHKDGDISNHKLENLQRLCRRCHSLTHNRRDFPEGVF